MLRRWAGSSRPSRFAFFVGLRVFVIQTPPLAALERESALLDELFRSLLEELMTGRVAGVGVEEGNG